MNGSGKTYRKVLVCVTEDWFALSHFKPLLRALRRVSGEVVIAARDSGRLRELEALGVRVMPFDFARRSRSPIELAKTVGRLRALIVHEQPEAVHAVAVQNIVLATLALRPLQHMALGLHVTGLGVLGDRQRHKDRLISNGILALIGRSNRRRRAHLFVENPDDRAIFASDAAWPADRITELGGAGVDPAHYVAFPDIEPPRIGFSGRLVRQKGLHVLVEAVRLLRAEGIAAPLDIFAKFDPTTSTAYTRDLLAGWQSEGLATWHGHADDIRAVWQRAAICVAPSISREGLPRAILEAASCARPLIVTDVAGSRRFVRDGIEGLIVPPDNAAALANAIRKLVTDGGLRRRLGLAARSRVLDGFTEHHVEIAIERAYRQRLLGH